jgi:mono/diheme cytochrome c family protein
MIRHASKFAWILLFVVLSKIYAQKQEVERPTGGVVDFLMPLEADPLLQHSKEVYVRNGCAYCHGIDLKVRNGEAADLMHSSIVAGDVDGNILGPLLRQGIPQTAKLSPMPQFSDLSDRNNLDLARWIHHSRQQGRFNELTAVNQPAGNTSAGEAYFQKTCAACHSIAGMAAIVKNATPPDLRKRLLKPDSLNGVQSFKLADLHNERQQTGRQRHGNLLENYTPKDIADLTAWLRTLR